MKKNIIRMVIAMVVLGTVFSCTSYNIDRTDKTSELNSIASLTFDNKVDMNNIVDFGMVEATATVTEIFTKDSVTYKSEYFEVVLDKKKNELKYKDGSVFHNGVMTPLTAVASTNAFALFFAPKPKDEPVLNARTLAQSTADYFLLEAAKGKGATTVMLPQYSWEVKVKATGKKWWKFDQVESSERTYTVKVVGRAVSFKASGSDNALSVKVVQ